MKSIQIIVAAAFVLCLAAAHPVKAADDLTEAAKKAAAATEAEKAPDDVAPPPKVDKKKIEMSTFFMTLKDGDVVKSPFVVKIGVKGFHVSPAGTKTPGTGHLHLFVDTELTDPKSEIPADAQHIHLGKGQKETKVTLPSGKHTLLIVVSDGDHIPFDPPVVSDKITVNVK